MRKGTTKIEREVKHTVAEKIREIARKEFPETKFDRKKIKVELEGSSPGVMIIIDPGKEYADRNIKGAYVDASIWVPNPDYNPDK